MNKVFFVLIHLGALSAFWVGVSPIAIAACLLCYFIRMFAITAGYHRLFSHRSYRTGRAFQLFLGILGSASAQKGPLWWAASHRHHHKHSDTEEDLHSPGIQGLWWAHIGWVLSKDFDKADMNCIKDLTAYPELVLLEKFHYIPPLILLALSYILGVMLEVQFPALRTSGFQMMTWGALMSTVLLYHGTFAINSLAHVLGRKRFRTGDDSRNSFFLSLITLGEGWHNNHHRYPGSERQGFYWWEIDITHYILKVLSWVGVVWDLREPPARIYAEAINTRPARPVAHRRA
jgi:stearoyl-CoA desaturase (Delta-9 desaturase)